MNGTWFAFDAWLLHSALGGGLLLLLCWVAMKWCRQPAWRQRLGEWGLAGALLLSLLSLVPAWLIVPVLPVEAASGAANSNAPPISAPLPSPAPPLERSFLPQPPAANDPHGWSRTGRLSDENALAMAPSHDEAGASNFLSVLTIPPAESSPTPSVMCAPAASQAASKSGWWRTVWRQIVIALEFAYGLAVVVFLGRWLFGHWILGNLLRASRPAPRAVARLFRQMARGHKQRPRLLVCPRIHMPVSCGLRRPLVLIPSSFCQPQATRWLPWVFAHELTHLERRDALACFLFGLGQALYFYVPWFWSLRRQVRLCQEYIADAVAARHTGEREDYAQFLLTLVGQPGLPLCTNGVSGYSSDLYRRVTMLLDSKTSLEKGCPRWWSFSAAGVVLAVAVLVSGVGLRARASAPAPQSDEPTVTVTIGDDDDDAPPKEKAKKKAKKAESDEDDMAIPGFDAEKLQKELQKLQAELQNMQKDFNFQIPKHAFQFNQDGNPFRFGGHLTGRLGVEVHPPSATLVEQLNLPKDQGLDVVQVAPGSAASKAGVKAHDILLELDGRPVSSDPEKLTRSLQKIKAKTPVDAVVLRKGKRVTIEGISLPEPKAQPNVFFADPTKHLEFPQGGPFGTRAFTFSRNKGDDEGNVAITVNSTDGHFTATRIEGALRITVTGTAEDGKKSVSSIDIHDGDEHEQYASVEEVPAKYRARVQSLLETGKKGRTIIEEKSKKKTKGGDEDDGAES